jgi:hypothetical protein
VNDITSLPDITKIYQAVQKLLDTQIDRQTGDVISLLSVLESRLKTTCYRILFLIVYLIYA